MLCELGCVIALSWQQVESVKGESQIHTQGLIYILCDKTKSSLNPSFSLVFVIISLAPQVARGSLQQRTFKVPILFPKDHLYICK